VIKLLSRPIIGPSITIAAILLCSLTVYWIVLNNSQELTCSSSNISRVDYEIALAKWNSLHLTEYEAIVQSSYYKPEAQPPYFEAKAQSSFGRWSMDVRVDNAYTVERIERLDNNATSINDSDQNVGAPTVDALFGEVHRMIAWQEVPCTSPRRHRIPEPPPPARYIVMFDPFMGYPRFFREKY
jgi:hypothetical protein